MVSFGHTAIGTIVGITTFHTLGKGDIAVGLVAAGFAGWASHYITDLIPHGHFFRSERDYKRFIPWVIIFDLLIPILFLLGLAHFLGKSPVEILYILFGIGGAQLPDVLSGLRSIKILPKLGLLNIEYNFHMSTHWHGQGEKALLFNYRDIWQITAFLLAMVILFRK